MCINVRRNITQERAFWCDQEHMLDIIWIVFLDSRFFYRLTHVEDQLIGTKSVYNKDLNEFYLKILKLEFMCIEITVLFVEYSIKITMINNKSNNN